MSKEEAALSTADAELVRLRQEVASLQLALEAERQRSAERLAEYERARLLLEATVEQCPVPLVVATAPDHIVRYSNRAAREALGISSAMRYVGAPLAEAFEKRTWSDLHPDGTPKVPADLPMARALRGETTRDEEALILRLDGTRCWTSVSATPIYDQNGQLMAGLVIFPDVTQRKRAEAEIQVVQVRLDLALDGADLGIWDWNVATGAVDYDRRWLEMLGYTRAQIEPTLESWENLVHPDDLSWVHEVLDAHLQGTTGSLELEHRLRHSDGSWVWVLSRGKVCERDPDGKARRVTGTHLNVTRRKQEELARQAAERESRQRAQETESLMKSMASAFVVWRIVLDAEGHLLDIHFEYFNDAYERVSGLTLEQVRGKTVREVWPGTEQGWYDVYGEIARTGVAKSFEMYHEPTRGLYACNAYRPPNLDDRICVVFEDITERKETLSLLEALASQQRAILNAVPAGISFLKDRQLQWINPELARMFGYEVDELRGAQSSTLYMHQYDVDRVGREGYSRLESGAVYSTEVLFKKKDGTPTWCHLTGQAVDAQASDKGSIWVLSDITERRQAEMALRESELRFKRLVQHSSDIIVVTDSVGVVLSASDSVARTLGYQPTELVGACGFDFVHPDDIELVTRVHDEILETPDTPRRVEFRHRHKNGKWVPLELVGTNLLYDPSVKGVVHNLRDISERSQLTEQLQQAMKMEAVGRLAGGIAHDFNNLLTVICGSIELLKMDLAPTDSSSMLLNEADAAAASAASLTRQLLAFSRRQMIEPKVLDLNELVSELRKLLARIIGEDIVLQTSLAKALGAVRVDPGQFEQVLVNLVVNARDAMPDGGQLVLETSNIDLDVEYQRLHPEVEPGRYVLLAVSDTGIGMDDRVKQRLFEPFFTTKPKGRGTGLGLATIFGTVKQAGGSIEVYSETGKGTTFKVYLPRVEAVPEKLARHSATPDIPKGTETVLLVEDEDNVRDLCQAVLRRLGYSVLAADSASAAISLAKTHRGPINLLMTDVVMPGMNGRELATELASIHPETRVLFASGYTENVIVHHGVVDEHTNFIGKPYTVQALAGKIREVLAPKGEQR